MKKTNSGSKTTRKIIQRTKKTSSKKIITHVKPGTVAYSKISSAYLIRFNDNPNMQYDIIEEIVSSSRVNATKTLHEILQDKRISDYARSIAIAYIGILNTMNIQLNTLINNLQCISIDLLESDEVRLSALKSLSRLAHSSNDLELSKEVLSIMDTDSSDTVKASVVDTYISIVQDRAKKILLDIFQKETSDEIRKSVIEGFGRLKMKQTVSDIISVIRKTDNVDIQNTGIIALSQIGTKRAAREIERFIDNPVDDNQFTLAVVAWNDANLNTSDIDDILHI